MSKTARIGAGVLLAAPLVALIANVVPPTISDEAGDRVAALTDHHTAMVAGIAADAISIALMIGGVIWLASALRSRAPGLALTGGVLGVVGALVVLFHDGMAAAGVAVVSKLGTAQATSVLDAAHSSGAGQLEPLSLLLNVGLICLGVAAIKAGAPTWLAAAVAVGAVAQGAGLATGTRLLAVAGFAVVFLSLAGVVRVVAGVPARQLAHASASPA